MNPTSADPHNITSSILDSVITAALAYVSDGTHCLAHKVILNQ